MCSKLYEEKTGIGISQSIYSTPVKMLSS